jgi:hypothetical protein
MADIKVEDLMRSIRQRARDGAAKHTDASISSTDSAAKPIARLQTSLTIAERTRDQLPPVTTYRSGLLARIELWVKRQLKRATHWYTREQVNFNSSVHSALNNSLAIFQTYEERLGSLQDQLDASLAAKANLESQLTELESCVAVAESRFNELLKEKLAEIRIEQQKHIELLVNEQRVCFKQLALEISETGVIADRTKRSIQLRLEELAGRVEKMSNEQREVNPAGEAARSSEFKL